VRGTFDAAGKGFHRAKWRTLLWYIGQMTFAAILRTRRWLLLLLALAFFYFYSGGGPNQGSRFNLDRAILELGQLTVDKYQANSEDKAFYRGHYYCDKAPGASLTALPALVVARAALRFVSIDPASTQGVAAQYRVATWSAATIPALLMCLVLFHWLLRKGYSPAIAVYSTLAVGLASPMWAYATLFWGNALASLCLVFGASSVEKLIHSPRGRRSARLALLAGLATGGAVVTEFPTAPMAGFLGLLLLLNQRPWRDYWARIACFVLGAMAAAVVLGLYNYAAFGSPFHLGYASVQGFDGMKKGLFGVTFPSGAAIAGVLWGPRGLLVTAPLLALGLIGHGVALARREHRVTTIMAVFCSIYPIILNVSYVYWDGGWTYGPRHMSSALPFLALGLAPLYRACAGALRSLRALAWAALAGAVFLTLIAVSVHGMTPYVPPHPLADLYWSSFSLGRFARHAGWTDTGGPASNLGLAFGLQNSLSLIPFVILFVVTLVALIRSLPNTPWAPREPSAGSV
jgi:hypothetical protein